MDKKEIKFEFERAMKNTYGFQEKSSCYPVTGTLYVQKSMFGSPNIPIISGSVIDRFKR